MKVVDPESFLFRLNVLVITVVFILLAPTTYIVAGWFPEDESVSWKLPLLVLGVSAIFWLLYKLAIPLFIGLGFFEERRSRNRKREMSPTERWLRIIFPIIIFLIQTGALLIMALIVLNLIESDVLGELFNKAAAKA